ncbi:hypothetical protein [Modicisalibacter xianhensis]|uniref:Uncharacterized protein n=1 Tax=Modicisalibacter xianhensis TaxID=442341 RepID=A0A1I2ZB03_9GAMM|nr:hypothetical protein [Halomonas xianhensis]SFH35023.1 hypothetical protein SAMN04487959_10310 [Halomonas xianhensis]
MDEGSQRSAGLAPQGMSQEAISEEFGLAPETIRTWITHWQQQNAHCRQWLDGLTPRVARCLLANGLETRDAIADADRRGLLGPGKIPGIGKQAHAEIAVWLGNASPTPRDNRAKRIAVTLAPETQAALKRLMRQNESPQAAINRVIVESEQQATPPGNGCKRSHTPD